MKNRLVAEVPRQHDLEPTELARLRQGCYRFYGALFLYPDKERLMNLVAAAQELRIGSDSLGDFPFNRAWRRLLATLQGLTEDDKAEVEEEYVRLFLAKPQAPLYESFYVDPDGHARGLIVTQLEREYVETGLALSPTLMDLPDHIAVELEFMSFLCGKEVQAWEAKAGGNGIQARERQGAFLGQHLGRWFPLFARRVRGAASERLYSVAVEAAYAFLHYELDLLHLRHSSGGEAT